VGLGVQNMSRKYETTVPYRPEMINIIRTAYDHGVTFFDTAEAYGPLECERILGESIVPFRNKIVITSKFGWNIDPETGQFQMGLNSKPDHMKRAVEGMLKRLRTDRIDLLYQHRVDPRRFRKSRDAACYVGLQPGRRNSGHSEPQLHITREGDSYLRMVLVQGAQHILGPFGEDSDLRRWGLKLAERGGKSGKKRAIVAVARKLAVLLHHLWISCEEYEPLHNARKRRLKAA
jgi:hypothetical protein